MINSRIQKLLDFSKLAKKDRSLVANHKLNGVPEQLQKQVDDNNEVLSAISDKTELQDTVAEISFENQKIIEALVVYDEC